MSNCNPVFSLNKWFLIMIELKNDFVFSRKLLPIRTNILMGNEDNQMKNGQKV